MNFTFNNINMQPETYKVEITIGNTLQTKQINTIPFIAAQEFQALITQLSQDSRPCKIRFSKKEDKWLELSQQNKSFEIYSEFRNKAYGDKD